MKEGQGLSLGRRGDKIRTDVYYMYRLRRAFLTQPYSSVAYELYSSGHSCQANLTWLYKIPEQYAWKIQR